MKGNNINIESQILKKIASQIASTLLLNAYTIESPNLKLGKIGIAVTLFELSRFIGNDIIYNHAFDLLQESLTYDIAECNFDDGKAGIAYAIYYLIKNKFIDADYMELYGDKHTEILNDISTRVCNKQEQSRHIGDLFFINTMIDYLSKNDYCKCQSVVIDNICIAMEDFYKKINFPFIASYFYEYAARLLAVCNSTHFYNIYDCNFLRIIEDIQNELNKKDIICNSLSFSVQMYKYGVLHNNSKFHEEGKSMLRTCINNLVIPALNFRQKTNLILSLSELYTLDSSMDYRNISNKAFDTLINNDINIVEQVIFNQIFNVSPFGIGLYEGVSRLALLLIYHEPLLKGRYPKHLFGLLN